MAAPLGSTIGQNKTARLVTRSCFLCHRIGSWTSGEGAAVIGRNTYLGYCHICERHGNCYPSGHYTAYRKVDESAYEPFTLLLHFQLSIGHDSCASAFPFHIQCYNLLQRHWRPGFGQLRMEFFWELARSSLPILHEDRYETLEERKRRFELGFASGSCLTVQPASEEDRSFMTSLLQLPTELRLGIAGHIGHAMCDYEVPVAVLSEARTLLEHIAASDLARPGDLKFSCREPVYAQYIACAETLYLSDVSNVASSSSRMIWDGSEVHEMVVSMDAKKIRDIHFIRCSEGDPEPYRSVNSPWYRTFGISSVGSDEFFARRFGPFIHAIHQNGPVPRMWNTPSPPSLRRRHCVGDLERKEDFEKDPVPLRYIPIESDLQGLVISSFCDGPGYFISGHSESTDPATLKDPYQLGSSPRRLSMYLPLSSNEKITGVWIGENRGSRNTAWPNARWPYTLVISTNSETHIFGPYIEPEVRGSYHFRPLCQPSDTVTGICHSLLLCRGWKIPVDDSQFAITCHPQVDGEGRDGSPPPELPISISSYWPDPYSGPSTEQFFFSRAFLDGVTGAQVCSTTIEEQTMPEDVYTTSKVLGIMFYYNDRRCVVGEWRLHERISQVHENPHSIHVHEGGIGESNFVVVVTFDEPGGECGRREGEPRFCRAMPMRGVLEWWFSDSSNAVFVIPTA